jgi:DNA-binding transcriptional LysR family regulator
VNFRFQGSGQPARWPFRIGDREVDITPSAGLIVDEGNAVMTVLAAGGGIGVSPSYVAAPYVARRELVPILRSFAVQRSHINALWPNTRRGSPNVRAFITFLSEIFPSPPPWDELVGD